MFSEVDILSACDNNLCILYVLAYLQRIAFFVVYSWCKEGSCCRMNDSSKRLRRENSCHDSVECSTAQTVCRCLVTTAM